MKKCDGNVTVSYSPKVAYTKCSRRRRLPGIFANNYFIITKLSLVKLSKVPHFCIFREHPFQDIAGNQHHKALAAYPV